MRIVRDGDEWRIAEPFDFDRFSVQVPDGVGDSGGEFVVFSGGYAWVEIDCLKNCVDHRGDASWQQGVSRMIDFARSRGWINTEHTHLRAHVV